MIAQQAKLPKLQASFTEIKSSEVKAVQIFTRTKNGRQTERKFTPRGRLPNLNLQMFSIQ